MRESSLHILVDERDTSSPDGEAEESSKTPLTMNDILTPGIARRVSQQDVMSQARKLAGHGQGPCYVAVREVSVVGRANLSNNEFATVGSAVLGMLKGLTLQRQKQIMKPVLTKIDTAFAPGKMCLVLGPPHSGKSSLLKSIADILDSSLDLSGSVSFNGVHPARCILPRIVSYTPQVDNHTAVLTVRETLDFAFDCTCSKFVHEVAKKNGLNLSEAKHMGINPRNRVDVVLHYVGLEHCKDTVAGDGT